MKQESVDYLIVGAGLIGSSTAMHLGKFLEGKGKSIAVVDTDLGGKLSSSERNAGGVRTTWDQELNVRLAKDSIDFFSEHAGAVGFEPDGYLWLFPPTTWDFARKRSEKLSQWGISVEDWTIARTQDYAPFLDKTSNWAGSIFSPGDGLLNPNLLKELYRKRAKSSGVVFMDGHHLLAVEKGFELDFHLCPSDGGEGYLDGSRNKGLTVNKKIQAKVIVNCAGAWAKKVATQMGYDCPTWPLRRQISIFTNPLVDMDKMGMVVDTSGVYFHRESGQILAGFADPEEKEGLSMDYGGEKFFQEKIWTPLYERSSKFESLKHNTGWAGAYAMTPDCSPIIGKAREGIYEAHSFCGRGAMQSYGAGRGIAEKIAFGSYQTIDLTPLQGDRFIHQQLVVEGLHI